MTPFFRASRRSLAYQFSVNAPLLRPPFSIIRKFLNFQPYFGQNSNSLDPNFSKFSFPRPPFFKVNPFPRPYILKPAWHTPKKLSAPSPRDWTTGQWWRINSFISRWSIDCSIFVIPFWPCWLLWLHILASLGFWTKILKCVGVCVCVCVCVGGGVCVFLNSSIPWSIHYTQHRKTKTFFFNW